MLDVGVLVSTFALIFVAELPDKSAFASLVLGTRFKVAWVFAGVAAAFATHTVIAVAAGQVLRLLPQTPLQIVVAALFAVGAVLIWREGSEDEEAEFAAEEAEIDGTATTTGFWKVAGLGYSVIFIGEWGDLTQIMTANLAARHDDVFAVGIGSFLGEVSVALLAMLFGRSLLRVIPMKLITRIAAAVLLVLAAITIMGVIRG